ncbi:MAG: histidine kinase [Acidobacteriota bacterium]
MALRIARLVLAMACAGWYLRGGYPPVWIMALFGAYTVYAAGALLEMQHETPLRATISGVADVLNFALWAWLAPEAWTAPLVCAYVLASSVLMQNWVRAAVTAACVLLIATLVPPSGSALLLMIVVALLGLAAATGLYRFYLEYRMSMTLRHNVIIRSQAQGAREAERQRIAADFHDGPLQSFVGFQMRLEIIRKLMERNTDTAHQELLLLQELCKGQVADLRSFVRSMRPADEGMSLAASLNRMADSLQRDTGISAVFNGEELHDPQEIEVSLEILQIVREAFNNIQKHSGATRVTLSASRQGQAVEIGVEDNGRGFPFSGSFTLEELDALRLGPISIKRRIKMLGGEMTLESQPGDGSKLIMRVPF